MNNTDTTTDTMTAAQVAKMLNDAGFAGMGGRLAFRLHDDGTFSGGEWYADGAIIRQRGVICLSPGVRGTSSEWDAASVRLEAGLE